MKIREMRKRRQEARKTEHLIGQPAKKRRKKETNTDEQTGTPNRYNNIYKTPGKKRKLDGESPNSPAKTPRLKKSGPLDRFLISTVTKNSEENLQETEPVTTPNQPKAQVKSYTPESILTRSTEAPQNIPQATSPTVQNPCPTTPTSVKYLQPTNQKTTLNLQSLKPRTPPQNKKPDPPSEPQLNPQSPQPRTPTENRKPNLSTEPQPKPTNLHSPYVFILMVEFLLIKINYSDQIEGITWAKSEGRSETFADDTTIYIKRSEDNLRTCVKYIEDFANISCLHCNQT